MADWIAGSRARRGALLTSLALTAGLLSAATSASAGPAADAPWKIETVAGGDGGPGPARGIDIGSPCAVSFAAGRLYVGNNGGSEPILVRSISMRTGVLSTPAGAADTSGPGISGIPARDAGFSWVCGLTTDHSGNLLISDGMIFFDGNPGGGDNLVRVVAARSGTFYGQPMTAGHVYTIAGDGRIGFSGDGGPATRAELSGPAGLAVDPVGNVIVADAGNDRLRVIAVRTGTFYGKAMTAGNIYTIAGDGTFGYSGNGAAATAAALSIAPQGDGKVALSEPSPVVAVDHAGNVVLADGLDCHVRVVAARTGRFYGRAMKADDIYTVAGGSGCGFSGDRGPATRALLSALSGVAVDGAGNIVVTDSGNDRIRVVAARSGRFYGSTMKAGDIYTVAGDGTLGTTGDGGLATRAEFAGPAGVAVDNAGNILVADGQGVGDQGSYYSNFRVRVVAARSGSFYGQRMTAGHIYAIAGTASAFTGEGGLATHAQIGTGGMTLDRAGNQVITDADGKILVADARSGRFYGIAMRAGHIYSIAGGGTGFPGGGRLASRVRLDGPVAVTTDAAGNLLIALSGALRVCVLAVRSGRFYGQNMRAGRIYLLAGNGEFLTSGDGGPAVKAAVTPADLAVDRHGNVLVADWADGRLRLVAASTGRFYGQTMRAGDIYTIAGDGGVQYNGDGERATAAAVTPKSVALDRAGNFLVADWLNHRVRLIAVSTGRFYGQKMTAGHIYTIAGDGSYIDSGDGGLAVRAGVAPQGVAVDAAGNVLVSGGGRIRVVPIRTGTYYGLAMTAGHIYTVAGGGTRGLGDGGLAVRSQLFEPATVIVAPSGSVYVADAYAVRVIFR